jgi:cell division protein FtsW
MVVAGFAGLAFAIHEMPERTGRFLAFMYPDKYPADAYQTVQGLIALGSGGVEGLGLGNGRQKMAYLPFAHTDFIFAILGEETGLVGTLFTLGLYLFFLWRGLKIALTAPTPTYKMIAAGITLAIVAQALMNMSIVLGLGPAKGTPLPLLSYGRSSLICTLAAIGLLLHISRKRGDSGGTVRI